MRRNLQINEDAFSSTLDAIFFLVLVSISAVILLPNIAAEDQYRTTGYISVQEMDKHLLNSILSSRFDYFEYTFKPAELTSYNLSLPNNSMMRNVEETLYQREQKHKAFADLLAESLVLGLEMKAENNQAKILNPMATEHISETKKSMQKYLESEIGGRYNYRLEARWYPVNKYIGTEIILGDMAPDDATRQSTKISLPLEPVFSRKNVFESMNDTVFQNALASSDPEYELRKGFNNGINVASAYAAETITEIIFPADYLKTLIKTNVGTNSEQLSLIASPEQNIQDPEFLFALQMINYTANEVYEMNVTVPEPDETININFVDIIETGIQTNNQEDIASFVRQDMTNEINQSISMILSENDSRKRLKIRDQQLESICRNYDMDGADITLFLW